MKTTKDTSGNQTKQNTTPVGEEIVKGALLEAIISFEEIERLNLLNVAATGMVCAMLGLLKLPSIWHGAIAVVCLILPTTFVHYRSCNLVNRLRRATQPLCNLLSLCAQESGCDQICVIKHQVISGEDNGGYVYVAGMGLSNHEGRALTRMVGKYLDEDFPVANVVPLWGRHVCLAVVSVAASGWRGKIVAVLGDWKSCPSPSRKLWIALEQLGHQIAEVYAEEEECGFANRDTSLKSSFQNSRTHSGDRLCYTVHEST